MAVQTSLARCLRATPLLRPSHSATRGQLYQVYQRFGYASNDSPDTPKTNETTTTTPSTNSKEDSPKPQLQGSILDHLNLGSKSSASGGNGGGGAAAVDQHTARLAERMADIRRNMQEIARPTEDSRTSRRAFFVLPSKNSTNRATAEAEASRTLGRLSGNQPPSPSSQEQQQQQVQQQQQQGTSNTNTSDFPLGRVSSAGPSNLDDFSPPTAARLRPIAMKLGTKLGRQIHVQNDKGIDCASAIRMLEISCTTNGLRRQVNLQKFHVRRGQRRKDLRRQRWRKLFKFSFDETVKKIQRMRDQGW